MNNNDKYRNIYIFVIFMFTITFFISGCASLKYISTEERIGIPNFAIVNYGAVYRGGQPKSPESWAYLKNIKKVKTVVKLNPESPNESDLEAKRLEMNVIEATLPPQNISEWTDRPNKNNILMAIKALMDPQQWPIFVHCTHGQDRTGLIIAMFRVLHDGYSKEEALD
jgi:protein tyrosine/serine phosphatase